jgi:NAD(P)-dependent dehydrogenase (short-subunit alcohol dehydrogenase family)
MKKIFLTGASSGIGLATAKALLARGDEVWGTSRDVVRLPQIARLHPVALDLSDASSIRARFESALAQAGQFDAVINNAGHGHFGPAESLLPADLANYFQVLLFAQIELMRLALESMRNQERGLIINVSSLASRLPIPFMAAYNAAKAALASYTMTMQLEGQNRNVRLVDLQPGDIRTQFNEAIAKSGTTNARVAKAWQTVARNMKAAPPPELVAQRILKIIDQENPPPRVTVGDLFQSAVAPLIFRLLPQRLQLWGLRKYYGI